MKRREFLILGCAAIAGCAGQSGSNIPVRFQAVSIDAGSSRDYPADGVYDRFHDQGFFVVRRGEKLFAISSICTHRRCALKAQQDQSFYCKCHGSTFDPDGHVTEGPATIDLPVLASEIDGRGHLIVKSVAAM
jgi:cytochrome b6-f complex iron-sulfur subunit